MTYTKKMELLILSFLLLILELPAHASSCISIVNRINDDINKYSTSIESQHLNWMRLSWLQKNLGPAQVEKASNNQINYRWQCNSDNYLVVQINSAGTLISVNGLFSSDNGSGLFAANFTKSATSQQKKFEKHENSQPIVINIQPSPKEMEQITKDIQTNVQQQINKQEYQQKLRTFTQEIKNYNQHYNTSIQNLDELQTDMTRRIKDFSEKLRQCMPGTYQYAIAGLTDILYATTTIKGKQGDLCIAETAYPMYGLGNVYMNCQFQPQNLQTVADQYPELAVINKSDNTVSPDHNVKAINDCKTTVTGLLQQFDKK